MSLEATGGLPAVGVIGFGAPLRWLGAAWQDMGRALWPCLAYGFLVALASFALSAALILSNLGFWALTLSCGFVFVAPMLAMGLYEAGRLIEAGEQPRFPQMMFVSRAVSQDVMYLGLALLFMYFMWGRIAQIVYGLSTYRLYATVSEFVSFALGTPEGHSMLMTGTIIGGVFAFFTYALVAVSAPMLLDRNSNVFSAVVTSMRCVAKNFGPMLLWAFLITALLIISAATGFWALVVVFPWLGLASWRAYRELVRA